MTTSAVSLRGGPRPVQTTMQYRTAFRPLDNSQSPRLGLPHLNLITPRGDAGLSCGAEALMPTGASAKLAPEGASAGLFLCGGGTGLLALN